MLSVIGARKELKLNFVNLSLNNTDYNMFAFYV